MDAVNASPAATPARRLDAPAAPSRAAQQAALTKAAEEFEGLFLNLLLKSMRSTVMESDLVDNGGEMGTYREMLDQELAGQLAGTGGLGVKDMIVQRYLPLLQETGEAAAAAAPGSRTDGDASASAASAGRPAVRRALEAYGARPPASPAAAPVESATAASGNAPAAADSLAARAERLGGAVADTLRTHGPAIEKAAAATGVEPELLLAVIVKESSGRADAVSDKGARGLMQLMPATAAEMGVSDPHDPEQNILGGARYLAWLRERFGDDLPLVLAGYNAGPGNVERAGRTVPPFRETENYVRRVEDLYAELRTATQPEEIRP